MLTTVGRIIYNDRIERALKEALGDAFDRSVLRVHQPADAQEATPSRSSTRSCSCYGASAVALVLDAFKDLGFKYATQAGITISKNDVVIPPREGRDPRARYEGEVAEIQDQYDMGLITQEERHEARRRQVDGGDRGGR